MRDELFLFTSRYVSGGAAASRWPVAGMRRFVAAWTTLVKKGGEGGYREVP